MSTVTLSTALALALALLAAGCSGERSADGAFELASDTPPPDPTLGVELGDDGEAASLRVLVADDGQGIATESTESEPTDTDPSSPTTGASSTASSEATAPADPGETGSSPSTVASSSGQTANPGSNTAGSSAAGNNAGGSRTSNNGTTSAVTTGSASTAKVTASTTSTSRSTTSTTRSTTVSTTRSTTSTTRSTTSTTATTRATTTTAQSTTTTARQTSSTSQLPPPSGDVIYVDRNASSGGNGSQSAPYNTLTKGLDEVKAGQTLIVKGGEYRERIKYGAAGKNTSSSKPILVQAAPGERVVVKGLFNLYNIDYWTIRGINVTWDGERNNSSEHMVLLKNGRNWVFEQAEVWGARSYSGLLIVGTPANFTVRNLHVHDTYRSNGTHQDHLIYCNCGSGGGVIERNLLVGSANGRGIKVGTPNDSYPSIANVKIRYNTIVDNTGPSNIQLSYKTSNITIENNLLVSPKDGLPNVTASNLSGGGNNIVRNNIGWDSAGVVENAAKLTDGGGNRQIDPRLDGAYVPANPDARNYGHRAP